VSNFDWRRPTVWSTPEYQIQTVSQSVKDTGRFLRRFFLQVASPNCILRGIVEPRRSSFFDTLVEDNLRARYVQDIRTFEYSARVEELAGFFRDQRWMHMHAVLRSQGISYEELGRRGRGGALASLYAQGYTGEDGTATASTELARRGRGGALASLYAQGYTGEDGTATASTEFGRRGGVASIEAAILVSLEADGITRIEALREIGHRLRRGALTSLEAQGYTGEDGTATASTELARRGRGGALASLYAQGYTGEDGTATASTEIGRRGGVATSAIYRKSGDCSRPGCTYAIHSGDFCKHHQPKKKKKSDKCRDCGRVFVPKEKVRVGVCNACYCKPHARAARKKATAAKKDTRGTCSTPGCGRIRDRGTDKCCNCMYPGKSSK
jgi:hypothetical protein